MELESLTNHKIKMNDNYQLVKLLVYLLFPAAIFFCPDCVANQLIKPADTGWFDRHEQWVCKNCGYANNQGINYCGVCGKHR